MTTLPSSQQWIVGLCSIVFDIDVGQRVECLVPEGCLSPEEQHDVAFHSFPDSMSMELHARTSIKDSTFFFRVRRRGKLPAHQTGGKAQRLDVGETSGPSVPEGDGTPGSDDSRPAAGEANGQGAPATAAADRSAAEADVQANGQLGEDSDRERTQPEEQPEEQPKQQETGQEGSDADPNQERFLYGFVFCRQRQDASLRRGGEQISVVVLAEHPLSSVLLPLSAVAGHQYFGAPGRAALQQVYDEVCRWSPPVAGPQLQLPVGFTALTARLPAWNTLPHPSTTSAVQQYGKNTLSSLRSSSTRSMGQPGSTNSSRRSLAAASDPDGLLWPPGGAGMGALRTASGTQGPGLSPSSSNASGVLPSPLLPPRTGQQGPGGPTPSGGSAANLAGAQASGPGGAGNGRVATPAGAVLAAAGLGGGLAAAAVLAASPFSTSGGGANALQEQAVIAPPQQHLERRRSSGGGSPRRLSSGLLSAAAGGGADAANGTDALLHGLSGGGTGPGASGSAVGPVPPPEGSLQQISGLLANGCSPATVPVYPVAMPVLGGLTGLPPHQRSRTSIQVPSRAANYAGADELLPASASSGGGRVSTGLQVEGQVAEDACGGKGAAQAWRRVPPNQQIGMGEGGPIHGAFHEVDVYTPLSGHLPRLWQLWELTLLGRALLLVAPSPGETAAGVAALIALVAPLPYAADFRPYYCIHDSAFTRLAQGVMPGPEARDVPNLMGVTNLYFIRALPHWPNVLSIGKRETGGAGGGAGAAVAPSGSLAASMARANAAVQALRQRTQGASVLMSGHTEALWSAYKPLCRPDQALLAKLLQPKAGDVKSKVARIAFVNSDSIRRHFAELTSSFLAPFSRYFEGGPDGLVPGWNSEEFLFGLRSGGVHLPQPLLDRVGSPAAAVELYARFTSSLNFAAWFAGRRRHVAHLIAPAWSPRQGGADGEGEGDGEGANGAAEGSGRGGGRRPGGMSSWFRSAAKHLDEVKLIGLFFSIEQQLMDAQVEAAAPDAPEEAAATVARLQRELALLFFGGMSEELQLTCVSSPARRELLSSLALTPSQAEQVQHLTDMLQLGGQ